MSDLTNNEIVALHKLTMDTLVPRIKDGLGLRTVYDYFCWQAVNQGWIEPDETYQYLKWIRELRFEASDPDLLDKLNVSEKTKIYFQEVLNTPEGAASNADLAAVVANNLAMLEKPTGVTRKEQFLIDLFGLAAQTSADSVTQHADEGDDDDGGGKGPPIDGGKILGSDLRSLVQGGATGLMTGGGAVAGAIVGFVTGSALEFLDQIVGKDVIENQMVVSADGGNPWVDAASGPYRWPDGYHDGDGYGLG